MTTVWGEMELQQNVALAFFIIIFFFIKIAHKHFKKIVYLVF